MKPLIAALALVLAACATDPTAPTARIPHAPSFDWDASAPVPVIVSAAVVDTDATNGLISVAVTYQDTADDEWVVSAYFTPDGSFNNPNTQNIGGTLGTGERSVTVNALIGSTTVRLQNFWKDPSTNTGLRVSSFSDPVTFGTATATATTKRKGKK